jgi:hypothetical protein
LFAGTPVDLAGKVVAAAARTSTGEAWTQTGEKKRRWRSGCSPRFVSEERRRERKQRGGALDGLREEDGDGEDDFAQALTFPAPGGRR